MELVIEILESLLHHTVTFASLALEIVGILIMIIHAVKAIIAYIKKEEHDEFIEKGISTSLEFLMCGEVLKTAVASQMNDFIALAAIIAIRFALAAEVHWEHKNKLSEHKNNYLEHKKQMIQQHQIAKQKETEGK